MRSTSKWRDRVQELHFALLMELHSIDEGGGSIAALLQPILVVPFGFLYMSEFHQVFIPGLQCASDLCRSERAAE